MKIFGTIALILLIVTELSVTGFLHMARISAQAVDPHKLGTSTVFLPEAPRVREDIVAFPTIFPIPVPEAPEAPVQKEMESHMYLSDAHAAVIIDVASGEVLYDQSSTQRRAIASLTKLFTAYVVRTSGVALDAPVTIHGDSLSVIGSRVGCINSYTCTGQRLVDGEVLTVQDLLTMMLVASANDAAAVLARYIAGSEKGFVSLMNERAKEIGLADSYFCTPSGLESDHEACYSSAIDIGRIGALAVHDDLIWKLLNTKTATVTSINGEYTHILEATNRFAQNNEVPGMLGAKTGFTPQAGKSLLMALHHPNNSDIKIVAVILGNPWRWRDIKTLTDWIWGTYEWSY